MLRILVISLFVVNLLLIGVWDKQPEVEKKAAATAVSNQDSNIPTIHLFSEMIEDESLLSDNRRCFSLGPFHSTDDLDLVYASLTEVSVTLSERRTQALVEKGYWAYLPPFSSLLEANEVLLSIQALGTKDVAVIYNGEWTNAISLGYFLRQKNAVRRKKSLEDRGYSPLIRVQRQAEDRYWLDYEQAPGADLIALDMQDRPNDFMQRSMPCPEREIVEEVVAAVQLPDPEPVEIAEEQRAQDEDDSAQDNMDQAAEDAVDTAIEDIAQTATNTVPEQINGEVSNDAEEQLPVNSVLDKILLTDPNYDEGSGSESDTDSEPEPDEESDPYDGDDIDFETR